MSLRPKAAVNAAFGFMRCPSVRLCRGDGWIGGQGFNGAYLLHVEERSNLRAVHGGYAWRILSMRTTRVDPCGSEEESVSWNKQ